MVSDHGININYFNQVSYDWPPINWSNLTFTVFPHHLENQQETTKN
jgi:hypothetical protein